jgi:hypothetical protein
MGFDATLATFTYSEKPIVNKTLTPLLVAIAMAANSGELLAGRLLAVDGDGAQIPYAADNTESIGTGDDNETTFSGTAGTPVQPKMVSVSDGTQSVTDNGFGVLSGDGSGTVNYETGAVSVTFDAASANAADVVMTYANQLSTVLTAKVDTDTNTVGSGIRFGCVVQESLSVDAEGTAPSAADIQALKTLNIYAL